LLPYQEPTEVVGSPVPGAYVVGARVRAPGAGRRAPGAGVGGRGSGDGSGASGVVWFGRGPAAWFGLGAVVCLRVSVCVRPGAGLGWL